VSSPRIQFISFYSYKGGVGRSTVLANLAYWRARQGKKVLIIDLDLEAPGQHKSGLFNGNPVADSAIKGGFIDLCIAWKQHCYTSKGKTYDWDLLDYTLRSAVLDTWPESGKGEIYLLPAGKKLDKNYSDNLGKLDWQKFFSQEGRGHELFAQLKLYCEIEGFEDVFIDSRTGLSDPYHMTTSWLSDTIICFTLLNKQSIEGCRYAMQRTQEIDFEEHYGRKRVLPIITMTPPTRNVETSARIKQVVENEWWEIEEKFVTQFEYDETLALEERIVVNSRGFEQSDFGKSLQDLNSALETSSTYLTSSDEARRKVREPELDNPFPNLRVEYWQPKDIAIRYCAIYPKIEGYLTNFQPAIIHGSRGTGKTTMARYFDHEAQLIVFEQEHGRKPKPEELPYLGLWFRLESDFLKAFNVPDEERQNDYNILFGLFFDLELLRKSLQALDSCGGLHDWVDSPSDLFFVLLREIGLDSPERCDLSAFLDHLGAHLASIRAYINNPEERPMPYRFQSNILMKLLSEQLIKRSPFHFSVFVDEVENYSSSQQKILNTRVKNAKASDAVTYKLLVRNAGIKTDSTDSPGQTLEVTHDYRDYFLDEEIGFDDFRKRTEKLVNQYISHSPQYGHLGGVSEFLERLTPEDEAKKICNNQNRKLTKWLEQNSHFCEDEKGVLMKWMEKEPNLLRQAVAMLMVNQGKSPHFVAGEMLSNTSRAQDWYHNYSRGALFWLCTLHHKKKTYSGFNDCVGIAGENIRVVLDLFYAIFEKWTEPEERQMPISSKLQNDCIHALSNVQFKNLHRFRPTQNRLDRLVERLGNLFEAIHKSPRQGEPEINHFSARSDLEEDTRQYLKECRRENLLQWMSSNKQKSSSDYLPDAFVLNPRFAPHFNISWRKKKKLELTSDEIHKLCLGEDHEWKKIHSRIQKQYCGVNSEENRLQAHILED